MKLLGIAKREAAGPNSDPFDLVKAINELLKPGQVELMGSATTKAGKPKRVIVVKASAEGEQLLHEQLGERVWIEEEIQYFPQTTYLGPDHEFKLQVVGPYDEPVPSNITVFGMAGGDEEQFLGSNTTNHEGFFFIEVDQPVAIKRAIITPYDGHWSVTTEGILRRIVCPRIDFNPQGIGWWHQMAGFSSIRPDQGSGIRIGVVDSGCGTHDALAHVQPIGDFSGGSDAPGANDTPHGTLVCGIIAARPVNKTGFWGIAPGATVFCANVAGHGDVYSSQFSIVNALQSLVEEHEVDLVNISLGCDRESKQLNEMIGAAERAGCLCICAAGNTESDVMWPAKLDRAVAVTALGVPYAIPKGTYASEFMPDDIKDNDAPFLASFSCRGPEVDCCGPGLGVVSTYPAETAEHGNAWVTTMGTSIASPAACAILAVELESSHDYQALPRNRERSKHARDTLKRLCRKIGLPKDAQGLGLVARATHSSVDN